MRNGLGFDDVLAVPKQSVLDSRSHADTSTTLVRDVELDLPIVSAAMDTVTEQEMAQAIADAGGAGFIHRYMNIEEQQEHISSVDGTVIGTVGVDEPVVQNARKLYESGADAVCINVAVGNHKRVCEAVSKLSDSEIPIIAGNIATSGGARSLVRAGADAVKVGIGSGSHCTTRKNTGFGMPQVTAVREAKKAVAGHGVQIISDGGIREPGHVAKAIIAGADVVMIGGMLAGCEESPPPVQKVNGTPMKATRGMASAEARANREEDNSVKKQTKQASVEGETCWTEYEGPVAREMAKFKKHLQSSISYAGARSLQEMKLNGELIQHSENVSNNRGVNGDSHQRR